MGGSTNAGMSPPASGSAEATRAALSSQESHGWGPDTGAVRRWLARELHDGVVQTLTAMVIDLEHLKGEQGGVGILPRLEMLQWWTRSALSDLRDLLREVRSEPCDVHDFEVQVAALVRRLETTTGVHGRLVVSPSWPGALPAHRAFDLYRIVEEALRNVVRHSGARNVVVALGRVDGHLVVAVSDDGAGLDSPPGAPRPGMGILGMRERAAIQGGRLSVATSPQGGTTVTAVLDSDSPIP